MIWPPTWKKSIELVVLGVRAKPAPRNWRQTLTTTSPTPQRQSQILAVYGEERNWNTPDDGCCVTRNMSSSFAVNKYLHTVASVGFLFTLNWKIFMSTSKMAPVKVLQNYNHFTLDAYPKLRIATISFVMSVRPNETTRPPRTDFHEISYLRIFRISVEKLKISLECGKNNRYCTWRPVYMYHNTGWVSR